MYIFVSYAREDAETATRVTTTLESAGFECFLDQSDLIPGQEYNIRIQQAVARADLFICLLSEYALEVGSYALTELAFAQAKWRNPAGYVLPVIKAGFNPGRLPAYLRPIHVLQTRGNVEAEILAWVHERARKGGGGIAEEPLEDRLERWARVHQPPLRRARKIPFRNLYLSLFGASFIGLGVIMARDGGSIGQGIPWLEGLFSGTILVCLALGILVSAYEAVQVARGAVGAHPVPALVLHREENERGVNVHLLLEGGRRKQYRAVGRSSRQTYPGELGWAFLTGRMLLDFDRG